MSIKYKCDNCGVEAGWYLFVVNETNGRKRFPYPETWSTIPNPTTPDTLVDLCDRCTASKSSIDAMIARGKRLSVVKVNGGN